MCKRTSDGFWERSIFLFPSAILENTLSFLNLSNVQQLSSLVGSYEVLLRARYC